MNHHACRMTLIVVICGFLVGCNTSRYGITYDECLPEIRTVAIVPQDIQVASLHTGGVTEPRPDITSEVQERLLQELQKLVTEKGYQAEVAQSPTAAPAPTGSSAQARALAKAVEESIVTHHYRYGKDPVFDYSLGELAGELQDGASDAIVYVDLDAVVPTAGRRGLQVTAAIVGAITGVRIHVKTNEAVLALMLIDRRTGAVLWYDRDVHAADVRSEHALRSLAKSTAKFLLKPRKK